MIGDFIKYTCPKCGLVAWIKEADFGCCPHCDYPQVKP